MLYVHLVAGHGDYAAVDKVGNYVAQALGCRAGVGASLVGRCHDETLGTAPCGHLFWSLGDNRRRGYPCYVAVGRLYAPPFAVFVQYAHRGAHHGLCGHFGRVTACRAQTRRRNAHLGPLVVGHKPYAVGVVNAGLGKGLDRGFESRGVRHLAAYHEAAVVVVIRLDVVDGLPGIGCYLCLYGLDALLCFCKHVGRRLCGKRQRGHGQRYDCCISHFFASTVTGSIDMISRSDDHAG